MALKVILFCFLFAQTSASFFDHFRGAMSSVEDSFGKLLSDVVTDVRDTIGCTILAVKQVLALGGIFHESSEYDARCRGISDTPSYVQEAKSNYFMASVTTNNQYSSTESNKNDFSPTEATNSFNDLTTSSSEVITTSTSYIKPNEKTIPETILNEIDKSVQNVNKTMFDLVTKGDTNENMEKVTYYEKPLSERISDELDKSIKRVNKTMSDLVNKGGTRDKIENSTYYGKPLSERISNEIDKSIQRANKTIFELVDKSDTHEKMKNVSNSLQQESDRLTQVSALLRQELSNISEEVKMELKKIEMDINNPTIQNIWNDVKVLHDLELNHRNSPEGIEIHHILDEVLNVLRGYNYQSNVGKPAHETDANNTFNQIKNQFINIEEEESLDLNLVEDIVEKDLNTKNIGDDNYNPNKFPTSFKDVAKKIMDETSRTLQLTDDPREYEEFVTATTEETLTEENQEPSLGSPDYSTAFELSPENSHSRIEAVKEATKLIEKSKETDAIMENYFKQTSDIGMGVFNYY